MSYNESVARILCEISGRRTPRIYFGHQAQSLRCHFLGEAKRRISSRGRIKCIERYTFATTFAKNQENKDRRQTQKLQDRHQEKSFSHANQQFGAGINPHFSKQHRAQVHSVPQGTTQEPMDIDPSHSRMKQSTQAQAYQNGKPASSGRSGPHKRQRVNHIAQSVYQAEDT